MLDSFVRRVFYRLGGTNLICFSFKKNIEEHEISVTKKMTDAISHRGPDDCQYYNDKDLCLGFRRLSIIDIKSGQQPMLSNNKNFCSNSCCSDIVFFKAIISSVEADCMSGFDTIEVGSCNVISMYDICKLFIEKTGSKSKVLFINNKILFTSCYIKFNKRQF